MNKINLKIKRISRREERVIEYMRHEGRRVGGRKRTAKSMGWHYETVWKCQAENHCLLHYFLKTKLKRKMITTIHR